MEIAEQASTLRKCLGVRISTQRRLKRGQVLPNAESLSGKPENPQGRKSKEDQRQCCQKRAPPAPPGNWFRRHGQLRSMLSCFLQRDTRFPLPQTSLLGAQQVGEMLQAILVPVAEGADWSYFGLISDQTVTGFLFLGNRAVRVAKDVQEDGLIDPSPS